MFFDAFSKKPFIFALATGIAIMSLTLLIGGSLESSMLIAGALLICAAVVLFVPAVIIAGTFTDVSKQLIFAGVVFVAIYLVLNMF